MNETNLPDPTLFDPQRARRLLHEAGIDLLLASRRASVAYLTDSFAVLYWQYPDVAHLLEVEDDGCAGPHDFAAIAQDQNIAPFAVAHSNRTYVYGERRCVADVRGWCERPGASGANRADVIAEAIQERRIEGATIGVEMNHLPAAMLEALRSRLPKARFVAAENVLWSMRAVKTQRELERLSRAYRIGEAIYREVLAAVKHRAGEVTVGEIRAMQMAMATRAGCPPLHFGYVFGQTAKKRAWDMSADWTKQTIDPGDTLLLDLGLIWRGYTTDFGRNAYVGRAPAEIRDLHAKMVECRQQIAQTLRPGVAVCEVVEAANTSRKRLGLPPREGFGHSLGIECHEYPILNSADVSVLEDGMVLVIELVENSGPVAFLLEDAGLVTPRGWESICRMGTELVELG
jgi:Xaa-Pro aminopeptidase